MQIKLQNERKNLIPPPQKQTSGAVASLGVCGKNESLFVHVLRMAGINHGDGVNI